MFFVDIGAKTLENLRFFIDLGPKTLETFGFSVDIGSKTLENLRFFIKGSLEFALGTLKNDPEPCHISSIAKKNDLSDSLGRSATPIIFLKLCGGSKTIDPVPKTYRSWTQNLGKP